MPAQNGDQFFRSLGDELKRFLSRRVACPDTAADLTQETFLRLLGAQPAIEVRDRRAYLFRVATNLLIDLGRRQGRRGQHASLDDVAEALVDTRPALDRALEMRQQLAILRSALEELPPNCRAALVLNRIEGLSHADVGKRLGVSTSMVSKYIMQALRHCARRLGMPRR